MPLGELFILSAPSGAGKTTLIQSLVAGGFADLGGLAFSVSHSTRKPRQGEIDGRDYHFVDRAAFEAMIEADAFLEWAKVHDNYYGTSRDEVFPRLERGIDVLLDIDVQGAEQVMARCPRGARHLRPAAELPGPGAAAAQPGPRRRPDDRQAARRFPDGNQTLRSVSICYHQ